MADNTSNAPDSLSDSASPGCADQPNDADNSEIVSRGESREIGGRGGLDPTRYGDWEKNGRCIDF